ncbi:MAG: DUF438 domain-containing protein [Methanosphaera sp.]|nr:DUF438 domain-containing protein [Methanosphaera sp.]
MNQNDDEFRKRVETLKSYIKRVDDGESLESVQQDFKDNFANIPAKEMIKAEQAMRTEGVPFEQIKLLCDIHSVLFSDMTEEERLARFKEEMEAHKQIEDDKKIDEIIENVSAEVSEKTIKYKNTTGHPLNVLTLENEAIRKLIFSIKEDFSVEKITDLLSITKHYEKKDELMYPLLKDKYNYPGPSDVMWTVEDEIVDSLKKIAKGNEEDIESTLSRAEDMIFKEENILFPLCTENFSKEEWIQIAKDMRLYEPCLIKYIPEWDEKINVNNTTSVTDEIVQLPGGSISLKQLRAMLNILPMEITLIDENDINRFFDEKDEKLFTRPHMALNRNMYSCHPPKVEKIVKGLLKDFKSGEKDSVHLISMKSGKKVLINYYALRDENGEYLGTMEAVLTLDSIIENVEKGKMGIIEL